jgi:hypothetical protein
MAEFESYKGTNAVIAESVYQFLRGSCWGAVWGLVTPIYPPGTVEAKRGTIDRVKCKYLIVVVVAAVKYT